MKSGVVCLGEVVQVRLVGFNACVGSGLKMDRNASAVAKCKAGPTTLQQTLSLSIE